MSISPPVAPRPPRIQYKMCLLTPTDRCISPAHPKASSFLHNPRIEPTTLRTVAAPPLDLLPGCLRVPQTAETFKNLRLVCFLFVHNWLFNFEIVQCNLHCVIILTSKNFQSVLVASTKLRRVYKMMGLAPPHHRCAARAEDGGTDGSRCCCFGDPRDPPWWSYWLAQDKGVRRGGPRDNPKQEKSHRSANSREAARAVSERGPRIGDRATHVRGARWVQNNSLRSSRATRFGDFINLRGCLSSFAFSEAAGILLLVAVVEVMLSNGGKRWNLARHSQRFWQLVARDLGCFLWLELSPPNLTLLDFFPRMEFSCTVLPACFVNL